MNHDCRDCPAQFDCYKVAVCQRWWRIWQSGCASSMESCYKYGPSSTHLFLSWCDSILTPGLSLSSFSTVPAAAGQQRGFWRKALANLPACCARAAARAHTGMGGRWERASVPVYMKEQSSNSSGASPWLTVHNVTTSSFIRCLLPPGHHFTPANVHPVCTINLIPKLIQNAILC